MKRLIKSTDSTVVRLIKQLALGGLLGLPSGFVFGFLMAEDLVTVENVTLITNQVISYFIWLGRRVALVAVLISLWLLVQVLRDYRRYEMMDDDEADELYRKISLKHSYATIFNAVASIFAMVSLLLAYRSFFKDDGAGIYFPIYDVAVLIGVGVLQIYILKAYNRVRGVKITTLPTLRELKSNVMQMDEAELEANYKMAFDIVMNLSGAILPTIYFILFIMPILLQKVELTGLMITASIHLYIVVRQFKMARDFYR